MADLQAYEQLYRDYRATNLDYTNRLDKTIQRRFGELCTLFMGELGVPTNRNVTYERINTVDELRAKLGRLTAGGFRTAASLDVGGIHAVGIVAAGNDQYETRSTWSPFENEPVCVDELFAWLSQEGRAGYRRNNSGRRKKMANLSILPPERL